MHSEKALDNRTRKMVYNYISKHPGVSFGSIMNVLDLTEGTLRYHLGYLERENKILSNLKGKHKCYYSNQRGKSYLKPNFEFDTNDVANNSCVKIDDNHFINCYQRNSSIGYSVVLEVNTTTWAITTKTNYYEFDTQFDRYNSCVQIDTNHYINCYEGNDNDGFSLVLEVQT